MGGLFSGFKLLTQPRDYSMSESPNLPTTIIGMVHELRELSFVMKKLEEPEAQQGLGAVATSLQMAIYGVSGGRGLFRGADDSLLNKLSELVERTTDNQSDGSFSVETHFSLIQEFIAYFQMCVIQGIVHDRLNSESTEQEHMGVSEIDEEIQTTGTLH